METTVKLYRYGHASLWWVRKIRGRGVRTICYSSLRNYIEIPHDVNALWVTVSTKPMRGNNVLVVQPYTTDYAYVRVDKCRYAEALAPPAAIVCARLLARAKLAGSSTKKPPPLYAKFEY